MLFLCDWGLLKQIRFDKVPIFLIQNVKLTAEDVRLFEDGTAGSVSDDAHHEGLLVPYDKSFEVPKSSLIMSKNFYITYTYSLI